jgi:hypothetical protein
LVQDSKGLQMRLALFLSYVAIFLSGCGSDAPPASALSVTITPASATVAANGTVNLSGSASGFTRKPDIIWYMQEGPSTPATPAPSCGYLNPTIPPSFNNCVYGYVIYNEGSGTAPTAVYHAPATPGTYHVVLQAMQSDGFVTQAIKTASAEITVTP